MISAASRGVEMFSLPRADDSLSIMRRCTSVPGAPRDAANRLIASIPSSSIRMFVAVLAKLTSPEMYQRMVLR